MPFWGIEKRGGKVNVLGKKERSQHVWSCAFKKFWYETRRRKHSVRWRFMQSNADIFGYHIYSLSDSQTWRYLRVKYGIGGESNYSAGMNNGVGKLPTSEKTLREELHSFYSYKIECYQKNTGQKVNLFLIKVGSQSLEVFNSFQIRQPRGSQ